MTHKIKRKLHVVISEETGLLLRISVYICCGFKSQLSATVERAIIEYVQKNPLNKYTIPDQQIPEFLNKEQLV